MFDVQMVPISPSRPHRIQARRQIGQAADGIDVSEEQLGSVTVQPLYRMCCECGRSWLQLELPTLVQCPECAKLALVSVK